MFSLKSFQKFSVNSLRAHVAENIYVYLLGIVCSFLYIYHLDYTTLVSWDEAWYANIARTIIETGDWMHMKWIGKPFYDHPPLGMWMMAAAFKFFGVSEFSTRLPSALSGVGTVLLVYGITVLLFKRKPVGFAAALVVATSVWFVARARSGNLDTQFTFFYAACIFTALRARANPRWFVASGVAFGGLIMTKTLIGISALPLIFLASFPAWLKPRGILYALVGAGLWCAMVLPWYIEHRDTYPEFMWHHFKTIGTRGKLLPDYFNFEPASRVMFYVHMGIRSWYKIWIVATVWLAIRLFFDRAHRWQTLFLFVWNGGLLFPFLSSQQAELWHLIPVYLPMSIIIAHGVCDMFQTGYDFVSQKAKIRIPQHYACALYVAVFIVIASLQVRLFMIELIPQDRYESERVSISKAIQQYDNNAYLDDDFLPEAIFYAGRGLTPIAAAAQDDPEYKNTLVGLFRTNEKDFIVITRWWATNALDGRQIPYEVIEKNKDFKIISRPGEARRL